MKTTSSMLLCCAIALAGLVPAGSARAEQASQPVVLQPGQKALPEDLTANLNTSFYSKYVWRGLELSKDSLVIFPSATIGYKGFAVNLWADLDTRYDNPPQGEDKEFQLWETDFTVTYSNSIKKLKMAYTLGWIYYDTDGFYGDTPTTNQEVFLTLAFDVLLKPTFSVYNEIQTGEARYFLLTVGHSFGVYKDWSLDLGASAGYLYSKAERYSDMHDGNVWLGLSVPLNSYITVTPKIQYSFPLNSLADDRIKANSFNGNDSYFVYGGLIVDIKL